MKKIPLPDITKIEYGKLIKDINIGNQSIESTLLEFKNNSIEPLFALLDNIWNKEVREIIGSYFLDVDKLGMTGYQYVDGSTIILNDTDLTIKDMFFNFHRDYSNLEYLYHSINSQINIIQNYTVADTFLELLDTPSTYVGKAGYCVGYLCDTTSLQFIKPSMGKGFLELSDTLNILNANKALISDLTSQEVIDTPLGQNIFSTVNYTCISSVPEYDIGGDECDNVHYNLNIQDTATCTSQIIRLNETYHEAIVSFNVYAGSNDLNSKYIEADTSVGITLNEGSSIGRYQLDLGKSYTFIYDEDMRTFYTLLS